MADDPTPMAILLRIVEVVELSLRNDDLRKESAPDERRAIQIINKFGSGSLIGSFVQGAGSDQDSEVVVGDQYTVGQAGAVGPLASAQNMTFQQVWHQASSDIDLVCLKSELGVLRAAMREKGGEPEHDIAVAEIASAEVAAKNGDGPSAISHLAKAGQWALDVAKSIGTTVAVAAIKASLGM
jgi:hypothetical protein